MAAESESLELSLIISREPLDSSSKKAPTGGERYESETPEFAGDPCAGAATSVVVDVPTRSKLRLFAVLAALYLALFVAALDQTIVVTAIPTIAHELHSSAGYTWIGAAYLLANAAAGPIWSKLSDIWGRRPILLTLIAVFFFSSIICATAVNMAMLIAGRAIQGTAGGGLIQLVHISISDLFSMRRRSLYLGMLEFMWALAGGIGPVLGGVLAQKASWRWIFWLNLPICGLTFALLFFFLDLHDPKTPILDGIKAIDWTGSISILGLALMFLLGLEFGNEVAPWSSPKVICLIVFGALMSLVFIYCEKRLAKYPLMPLGIFRNSSSVASLVVCYMHAFVFIGAEYYLPLYFQSVREASPLQSGVMILPITISEAAAGLLTGFIIHRTGRYRELAWIGMTLLTIGTGLYISLDETSTTAKIIGFELIGGLGAGLLFEPPLIALQANVSQDDTATATSTFGFVRDMSASMSVVIGGVVFQNGMKNRIPQLALSAHLPKPLVQDLAGADAAANVMLIRKIRNGAQKLAVKGAYAWSLRNMWVLYGVVSFLGLVATGFIKRTTLSQVHSETKTGLKKEEGG